MSKSVLLLDENPDVLSFLTHLLDARGVRVLRARTKCEAFEILGRDYVSVDLVLANVMIAEIDQGCLVREVASTRRGISVMFMSAFVDCGVIRVEAMCRADTLGCSAPDERGVIEAVLSALRNSGAQALGV